MATKRYQTRVEKISKALKSIEEINVKNIGIDDKYSQIKGLLSRKHLTRFFMIEKEKERIKILRKDKELTQEDTADGWFIVVATNKELSKEKVIEKYKELKYVEHGFYELKHSLHLRPNYHWTEQRIRGHVMVCFMSFQIGVLFETRLKTIGLSWERAMERLSRLTVIEWKNENRVRKGLLKVKEEQMNIYDIIGASKPTLMNL
jgi:transposase